MVRCIIAGGRDFVPNAEQRIWVQKVIDIIRPDVILSGGCRGADMFGEIVAEGNNIKIERYYAKWGEYGNSAGPRRNEEMAKNADTCILFPGGRGTDNMETLAMRYALKIYKWKADV